MAERATMRNPVPVVDEQPIILNAQERNKMVRYLRQRAAVLRAVAAELIWPAGSLIEVEAPAAMELSAQLIELDSPAPASPPTKP